MATRVPTTLSAPPQPTLQYTQHQLQQFVALDTMFDHLQKLIHDEPGSGHIRSAIH